MATKTRDPDHPVLAKKHTSGKAEYKKRLLYPQKYSLGYRTTIAFSHPCVFGLTTYDQKTFQGSTRASD